MLFMIPNALTNVKEMSFIVKCYPTYLSSSQNILFQSSECLFSKCVLFLEVNLCMNHVNIH